MKKIINGKKYDTETATRLADWENDYGDCDLKHAKLTLYRKKNGEYFLYGDGIAAAQYTKNPGNYICCVEKITPLTEDEAKSWAESLLDADEYEKIFGPVEE